MRLYLEPVAFYYQHDTSENSILPKMIFEKAKERKLELVTSALTPLQYLGSIHELFVTRKIKRQTRSDYLSRYGELKIDLRDSLTYVYPTKGVIDIGVSYSLDQDIHHERAIHMATAKASRCDMYIMIDENKDINKNQWKKHFVMSDISEREDRKSTSDKINQL